jgi:hypothetical protein
MTVRSRLASCLTAAASTSGPVWIFVAIEIVIGAGLATGIVYFACHLRDGVVLDELPPWRALALAPLAGAAAHLVRAAKPVDILRRWHGVAVRRIDERWAAER